MERNARPSRLPLRAMACAALLATPATGACDRLEREQDAEPLLTLRVETPETLTWGGTGVLRLSLANEGGAPAPGAIIEVYVPVWLEFGSVEPPGTAVTVVSGDTETRLRYQLTDSLAPGDSRIIIQRLRVLQRPPVPPPTDSLATIQLEPSNQLVRARLLTASGEAVGVEVQAALNFIGTRRDTIPPADTLPDTARTVRDSLPDTTRSVRDSLPPAADTVPTGR
ncbi:MAG TPA: hypothetical protein VFZ69_15075 [Longimicrobiales bacterium]